jgi:hypothetical protein
MRSETRYKVAELYCEVTIGYNPTRGAAAAVTGSAAADDYNNASAATSTVFRAVTLSARRLSVLIQCNAIRTHDVDVGEVGGAKGPERQEARRTLGCGSKHRPLVAARDSLVATKDIAIGASPTAAPEQRSGTSPSQFREPRMQQTSDMSVSVSPRAWRSHASASSSGASPPLGERWLSTVTSPST